MALLFCNRLYCPGIISILLMGSSLVLTTPAMAMPDILEGQEAVPLKVEPFNDGSTLPEAQPGNNPVLLELPDNLSTPGKPSPKAEQSTVRPAPIVPSSSVTAIASVAFPAAGVRLQPPTDFTQATLFDGFQQAETQSSIIVFSLPTSTEEMLPAFSDQERLRQQDMRLISKEPVSISGQPGLLVQLEQKARGLVVGKWILIFGKNNKTTIVNANFPQALADQLSAPIKASLLTTQVDDSLTAAKPDASSSFRVTPTNSMALALNLSGTLLYSQGGKLQRKGFSDPLFIVSPSFSDILAPEPRTFARDHLQQTEQVEAINILTEAPITIDNLKGYEITATAKDASTKAPLLVYQTILFAEDRYYIMQGLVGEATGSEYLANFKTMAESFQRK